MPQSSDRLLGKVSLRNNLVWENGHVTKKDRNQLNQHQSAVFWFTGLPGAGKSTLAHRLEKILFRQGIRVYVLDGDNVRHGLNGDLGFDRQSRRENIRRIMEVAKLFADAGMIVLCAFISPYITDRDYVRNCLKGENFFEIYVKCSLDMCIQRDIKGHYEKARLGLIKDYTGVSAPYEVPASPDLTIDTEVSNPEASTQLLLDFILRKGLISPPEF
jgi:adenylylsulfate kinase